MNRLAVVLAADSASTVSTWNDSGQREERYFKGANKIFQISNHHPIGVMVFDSADILGVPWELVVKEFRKALRDKSFNSVDGYADEFFKFLADSSSLFPPAHRKSSFVDAASKRAAALIFQVNEGEKEAQIQARRELIASRKIALETVPLHASLPAQQLEDVPGNCLDDVKEAIKWVATIGFLEEADLEDLANVAILDVLKNPDDAFGRTGLVFAGFGDHDIFPAMAEYRSFGVVFDHHVVDKISQQNVTHEISARIMAFAQTSMSDTFSMGLSEGVYGSVMKEIDDGLTAFMGTLGDKGLLNVEINDDLKKMAADQRVKIGESIIQKVAQQNAAPLRRVLAFLPINEMADLAESLISLQSLKEKVTKPSETVGGPVDVAVITRSEGLIWIKRKHFFDPDINSRYMLRQQSNHG